MKAIEFKGVKQRKVKLQLSIAIIKINTTKINV